MVAPPLAYRVTLRVSSTCIRILAIRQNLARCPATLSSSAPASPRPIHCHPVVDFPAKPLARSTASPSLIPLPGAAQSPLKYASLCVAEFIIWAKVACPRHSVQFQSPKSENLDPKFRPNFCLLAFLGLLYTVSHTESEFDLESPVLRAQSTIDQSEVVASYHFHNSSKTTTFEERFRNEVSLEQVYQHSAGTRQPGNNCPRNAE